MEIVFFYKKFLLLIVVCFSFSSIVHMLAMRKEKTYSRLLGFSMLLPLLLGSYALITPELFIQDWIFNYLDIIFVLLVFLVTVFWLKFKYLASLLLLICYTVFNVALGPQIRALSKLPLLTSSYFHGVSILLLTVAIYCLLRNIRQRKAERLIAALAVLGFAQFLSVEKWLFAVIGARSLAYYLIFLYVFNNSIGLCRTRLKKTQSKLVELNRSIDEKIKVKIIELQQHNERLLKMLKKDQLVDAYNKKEILNLLEEMIESPDHEAFSVIIFDVDNFKIINDTKGHLEGDGVLKKVASIARESIRSLDVLGRFGGDEFVIILRGTSVSEALVIAERFRRKVREKAQVSVSVGVAGYPEDGKTVKTILEVADSGLYEAKKQGKNAVYYKNS